MLSTLLNMYDFLFLVSGQVLLCSLKANLTGWAIPCNCHHFGEKLEYHKSPPVFTYLKEEYLVVINLKFQKDRFTGSVFTARGSWSFFSSLLGKKTAFLIEWDFSIAYCIIQHSLWPHKAAITSAVLVYHSCAISASGFLDFDSENTHKTYVTWVTQVSEIVYYSEFQ